MQEIIVTGMTCKHCVASVSQAISALSGVNNLNVDLASGKASWEGDATPAAVTEAVRKIGFDVQAE